MIATVYDTKHAIAMTADNGAEILMHIGLDTVQLEGAWNVGIKDYKAHVTISSKRIHEAMDDTYYPKRHGFLRYAKTCFEHYGEYVKYWITFNEIDSIHRHSFITAGIIPDLCGEKGETQCCYQALHHRFVAAAKATILLREIVPDAKIGSIITKLMTYPYTCAPEDVAATQLTVGLRIALIELRDNGQLFVPFVPNDKQNIIQLLQEVPEEYPEITKKIVFYAENVLNTHLNPHIYLTLTDHLHFAVKRDLQNIVVVKRVFWEMKTFYKKEYDIGLYALKLINNRLAVDLPEEEAANIAFYIINTQNDDINHDAMRYKPDKESIHYYIFKSIFPWQLCQNNRYKHQRTSYQFSLA